MIQFDETTHTYSKDGVVIPSVTQIIKGAGMMGDTSWYTEESKIRGTHVHKATEFIDRKTLDWDSVDHDYLPYLEAYKLFLDEIKPEWSGTEERIFSPLGYAGTFDRLGFMFGKATILDIKTGPEQAWHGIQLAMYADVLPGKFRRFGLYLRKNGSYRLTEYTDRNDIKIAKALLSVHKWKEQNGVK